MLLKLFTVKSPKSFRGAVAKKFVDDFNRIFEFCDGFEIQDEGFGRARLIVYMAPSPSIANQQSVQGTKYIPNEILGEFYRFMNRWIGLYSHQGKLINRPIDYNAKLIGSNCKWYVIPRECDALSYRRFISFSLIQIVKQT